MTANDMTPEERIDQYLLGQAKADDVEVLNELLTGDEQLRKLYRFRVALEGGYREAALRFDGLGDESSGAMLDASLAKDEAKKSNRKSFLYGFAVAAASLAAVALVAVTQWNLIRSRNAKPRNHRSIGKPACAGGCIGRCGLARCRADVRRIAQRRQLSIGCRYGRIGVQIAEPALRCKGHQVLS